jgi:hypothetical protein
MAARSQDFGRSWTPLRLPALTEGTDHDNRRREIEAVVSVCADGVTFIATTKMLTRDRGRSWIAVRGLPDFARPVADRVDARRFYVLDFEHSRIAVSDDGGQSFAALRSSGLPAHPCAEQPTRAEDPWPLLATPGRARDVWLVCRKGLYHSVDGGHSFTEGRGDVAVTALAFGKPKSDGDYPTLFAIGTRGDLKAIWRSDNAGATWLRINDAAHEYGRRFRVISADQRVFGRVYVGTDGRGVLYGEPSP